MDMQVYRIHGDLKFNPSWSVRRIITNPLIILRFHNVKKSLSAEMELMYS